MGRTYAGSLGLLACGITLIRGLVQGASSEATILTACGGLFLFALVGYVAGELAELFVRESVRTQFQAALAEWERTTSEQKPLAAKTN
jgi:hypothetical protein